MCVHVPINGEGTLQLVEVPVPGIPMFRKYNLSENFDSKVHSLCCNINIFKSGESYTKSLSIQISLNIQ